MADLNHVLGIVSIAEETAIYHVEPTVELNDDVFFAECLSAIRDILRIDALRFQVLELLAIIQVEEKMLFVGCHFHATFRSPNDMGIFKSVREIVDEQVLHDTGLPVFFLDIDVVPVDVAIKDTFRDVQFRRSLFHGNEQSPEFSLCLRSDYVLEIERHAAEHDTKNNQWTYDSEQRNAGCFHGKQFEFLSEVPESHQGC